jgi:hypothetical protein
MLLPTSHFALTGHKLETESSKPKKTESFFATTSRKAQFLIILPSSDRRVLSTRPLNKGNVKLITAVPLDSHVANCMNVWLDPNCTANFDWLYSDRVANRGMTGCTVITSRILWLFGPSLITLRIVRMSGCTLAMSRLCDFGCTLTALQIVSLFGCILAA